MFYMFNFLSALFYLCVCVSMYTHIYISFQVGGRVNLVPISPPRVKQNLGYLKIYGEILFCFNILFPFHNYLEALPYTIYLIFIFYLTSKSCVCFSPRGQVLSALPRTSRQVQILQNVTTTYKVISPSFIFVFHIFVLSFMKEWCAMFSPMCCLTCI